MCDRPPRHPRQIGSSAPCSRHQRPVFVGRHKGTWCEHQHDHARPRAGDVSPADSFRLAGLSCPYSSTTCSGWPTARPANGARGPATAAGAARRRRSSRRRSARGAGQPVEGNASRRCRWRTRNRSRAAQVRRDLRVPEHASAGDWRAPPRGHRGNMSAGTDHVQRLWLQRGRRLPLPLWHAPLPRQPLLFAPAVTSP